MTRVALARFAVGDRLGKLWPVGSLAGLDLLVGRDDLVLAVAGEVRDARLLGLQTEPALALLPGADAIVWDESAHESCPVARTVM